MPSASQQVFKLGYEISPIILVNGIAASIPFQMLPIVMLTQAADFTLGLLGGGGSLPTNLDQYLCHWKPLPGTTLISNQVATYPFANQSTAANAIIAQPLNISMLMNCPVQTEGGYTAKLATFTVLQQTLQQHNQAGGTYTIATPTQIFTNCLLLRVADASSGDSKQVQHTWQFDFMQPLITINQAQQVYSSLMNKIAQGLPTGTLPNWSGIEQTTGASVNSGGTILPSATNLVGSSISVPSAGAIGSTFGFTI